MVTTNNTLTSQSKPNDFTLAYFVFSFYFPEWAVHDKAGLLHVMFVKALNGCPLQVSGAVLLLENCGRD